MDKLRYARIRKAVTAGVAASIAATTAGQVVGSLDTFPEWLMVISAGVLAGIATYFTPANEPD